MSTKPKLKLNKIATSVYEKKKKSLKSAVLRLGSSHFFDDYPGHMNPTSVGITQGIA